jgi:hypothetical protein
MTRHVLETAFLAFSVGIAVTAAALLFRVELALSDAEVMECGGSGALLAGGARLAFLATRKPEDE